jgi:hypothetical protein
MPLQPVEGAGDQGQCPVALEQPFGGPVMGRFAEEAALGVAGVDREDGPATAAPQGSIAVPAVRQEEAAIRQEERAEAALVRVSHGDGPLLQQPGEIVLGQVQGRIGVWQRFATKWATATLKPVSTAFRESRLRSRRDAAGSSSPRISRSQLVGNRERTSPSV